MGDLQIETKKSLLTMNTMALASTAEYFCSVSTVDEVQKALSFAEKHNLAVTPLGAGSNVVFASNLSVTKPFVTCVLTVSWMFWDPSRRV